MNAPSPTEELRDDIRRIVSNYPSLTIAQVVGVLEIAKLDVIEAMRQAVKPKE